MKSNVKELMGIYKRCLNVVSRDYEMRGTKYRNPSKRVRDYITDKMRAIEGSK